MSTDLIRYDLLVQTALRGVVRKVLTEAVRVGLPGEHHFYITFRTKTPGVRLSSLMRERYPDEMTIILQHQFRDLAVTEHAFEVGLSFNNVPERLLIPFDSVTGFFDPSVQFGLKFEADENPESGANDSTPQVKPAIVKPAPLEVAAPKSRTLDKTTALPKPPVSDKPAADKKAAAKTAAKDTAVASDPKIVSIDSFRKK